VWLLEVLVRISKYHNLAYVNHTLSCPYTDTYPESKLFSQEPARMALVDQVKVEVVPNEPILLAMGCLNRILVRYPVLRLVAVDSLPPVMGVEKKDGDRYTFYYYLQSVEKQ